MLNSRIPEVTRLKALSFGVIAVIAALAVTPAAATTIGYWNFEEGAPGTAVSGANSVLDQSGNANHGSPSGNPVYSGDVPVNPVPFSGAANGTSLALDGNGDYVSIAHSASLNPTAAFTVEFWMKSGTSNPPPLSLLVDKSHGFIDSTGWVLQLTGSGQIAFNIGQGGPSNSNFPGLNSTTTVLDDAWHHIAGTYDALDIGNELKLYIDGVLEGTTAITGYATNTRDINIGAACVFPACTFVNQDRFFNGGIDELRISDVALTSGQFLNAAAEAPEPAAIALFALGIAGLGAARRRNRP